MANLNIIIGAAVSERRCAEGTNQFWPDRSLGSQGSQGCQGSVVFSNASFLTAVFNNNPSSKQLLSLKGAFFHYYY